MIRHFVPDERVGAVIAIEPSKLSERGIRGLILDLDDTLVAEVEHLPTDAVCRWLEEARRHLKVMILSNNTRKIRVAMVAEHLGIPFEHLALKPLRWGFERAFALLELPPNEVAVVGDQLFTDVLGGRLAGTYTILVEPLTPTERKWTRKIMRKAERIVLPPLCLHATSEGEHARP